MNRQPKENGLYRSQFEKDNCGFGLIAQMDNKPSHWVVKTSIERSEERRVGKECRL